MQLFNFQISGRTQTNTVQAKNKTITPFYQIKNEIYNL